jgi:hypothetical protein
MRWLLRHTIFIIALGGPAERRRGAEAFIDSTPLFRHGAKRSAVCVGPGHINRHICRISLGCDKRTLTLRRATNEAADSNNDNSSHEKATTCTTTWDERGKIRKATASHLMKVLIAGDEKKNGLIWYELPHAIPSAKASATLDDIQERARSISQRYSDQYAAPARQTSQPTTESIHGEKNVVYNSEKMSENLALEFLLPAPLIGTTHVHVAYNE